MKHTIQFDEDHQLLVQTINGNITTEDAKRFGQLYNQLLDGKQYRQLIVNLRTSSKMETRETRSITNDMFNNAKLTEVVFVGANAAQRMIAKVLMKLGSLKAEANYVKEMEDAYNWIEKKRN